jgi:hypothetical protein
MMPSPRLVARTALVVFGLALAGCESMDTYAQSGSNSGNAPTTMSSTPQNHGSANADNADYWNDTRYIGNGAFGQPPPP